MTQIKAAIHATPHSLNLNESFYGSQSILSNDRINTVRFLLFTGKIILSSFSVFVVLGTFVSIFMSLATVKKVEKEEFSD